MIKDKIKSLFKLYGKTNKDGANVLNMPYASFTNKLNQRGFKTEELIKIADLTNTKLAFIDENNNPVIIFSESDIKH